MLISGISHTPVESHPAQVKKMEGDRETPDTGRGGVARLENIKIAELSGVSYLLFWELELLLR